MEQVMDGFRRKEPKVEIPVLRLEIDYELATLHDAMLEEDAITIEKTKQRLKQLSEQLMALEAHEKMQKKV